MTAIDQSLETYIRTSRQEGFNDQLIREALLQTGWQQSEIDYAFSQSSLLARAPKPTPLVVPKPPVIAKRSEIHSPFSIILALVLTFFLLIFSYHAINDLELLFPSISGALVIDVIMVIVFLFIAGALHSLLLEQKERYRTLTIPYFAVAVWLVLKLLFDVSQYIYGNVEVYGIYIVLLIIVAVLTVMTLLFQKYKDIL